MNANPYESPEEPPGTIEDTASAVATLHPPFAWSACVLLIGFGFLFLLDGQVFTNTLVFLGLAALSAVLWLPLLFWSRRRFYRRLALYVMLTHLVLIVFIGSGLAEAHRQQQRFNELRNKARQNASGALVNP